MATDITNIPVHSGTDATWASSAAASDVVSAPSDGEVIAGHVNNTGYTSGRANWLWQSFSQLYKRVRDSLLPQHTDAGAHTGITTDTLLASSTVTGNTVLQADTTERTLVCHGGEGIPVSFLNGVGGTVIYGTGTPDISYDENDATIREFRYAFKGLPAHATVTALRVVVTAGNAANVIDANLYNADNADNATGNLVGAITQITGVTGVQASEDATIGSATSAGNKAWWARVFVTSNHASQPIIEKVILRYTVGRL